MRIGLLTNQAFEHCYDAKFLRAFTDDIMGTVLMYVISQ